MTIEAIRDDIHGVVEGSTAMYLSTPASKRVRDISLMKRPRFKVDYHKAHLCADGSVDRMTVRPR